MRRPALLPATLVLVGLVLSWAIATAVLFVWPPQHVPEQADAVVVLAGSRGPRLAHAIALARRGVSRVLVVSDGWAATWPEGNRLCAGRPAPARVVCFYPHPYDTRGEAEGFARIARGRGWRSVLVVTSRYHLVRARILFDRCYDGTLYTAGADESVWRRIVAVPSETAKLAYALLLKRGC
jgi:uncharacterized SAM-binding protein YcdF (DUF218 family)